MTDLDALADEEATRIGKSGPRCWVCFIPEREWVDAQKGKRSVTVIVATLIRAGHPAQMATKSRLRNHLREHVR